MGNLSLSSAMILVARVLLLCLAGGAVVLGFLVSRREPRGLDPGGGYICPMHLEVSSSAPGDCPICSMALERGSSAGQEPLAEASPSRRLAEVERRTVTQVIRAPAWAASDGTVTAVLYHDEHAMLAPGQRALFFPRATPADGRVVRLSSTAAPPWDQATVKAGFRMENSAGLEPTTGWLELAARPRALVLVPESALLYSGEGPYVLAAPAGSHTFTRRRITLGRILGSGYVGELSSGSYGAAVVLAGLVPGERVVAADAFFLDAERRLQAAQGKTAEVIE